MSRSLLGVTPHTYCQPTSQAFSNSIGLVGGFVAEAQKSNLFIPQPSYTATQAGPLPDPANYRVPGGLHNDYYRDAANWSNINYPK